MGGFSIWHWLIVIIYIAVPVAAVLATAPSRVAGRRELGIWVVVYVAYMLAGSVVIESLSGTAAVPVALAFGISVLVVEFFVVRALAARCQDVRWSRWLALLWLIPVVNLVFVIVALVKSASRKSA